jgi:vacuolar-type H+-ATPase subunit F/Vma7
VKWVVVADEITAVGWRLTGAQVQIADEASAAERFTAASRSADLLFITAALAARIPAPELQDALLAERPLVLVIADLARGHPPPDVEAEVRRALGIGA